jgi:hypothetical protein
MQMKTEDSNEAWLRVQGSNPQPSFMVWGWEGYHESRRCSRDTYPESYITKYTSVQR